MQPESVLLAVRVDRDGHILVLSTAADHRWREALVDSEGPDGPHLAITSYTDYLDTIIEVFDRDSGQLLASRRLDQLFVNFIDGEHVVALTELADGSKRYDVWNVGLTRPR